ncbi:MAG: hypothetical protein CM15mP127_02380 [Gammaproteobacteria bacterium]|nr:MAG: hypothetical protein CM15mP127_02380 [Gammaproteobacteria bacterium]
MVFTALIALLVGGVTSLALRLNKESISSQGGIEYAFGILMIVTACAMAFAHGSNDVANAIGPVAAIISVVNSNDLSSTAPINPAILLLGGAGIVLGLTTLGYKVIKTVGEKITKLTPSLGFSAEMAAASTVVFASYLGFPISTTHTLIGELLELV